VEEHRLETPPKGGQYDRHQSCPQLDFPWLHVEWILYHILGHGVLRPLLPANRRVAGLHRDEKPSAHGLDRALAGECGWQTDAYLKRLFKRTTGLTMREWRRRESGA
jgi:hypothetical protein